MAQTLGQLDQLCQHLEELGAVDKIEQLQEHENQQVYKVAQKLIDQFFGAEVSTLNACKTNTLCTNNGK
jgi:importin subunit alpha-2